ncbi:non-homologous end-joining DNA ligase [Nocardioides sp. TRM66260-LWL]|uniref:non-homologous end-joining DNA ligase n=1 Tax=Nocardioides sp. TRM66260-LWL TaxID=2874478 RepID=UPI001CC341C6|nr:non-homologous end-joining DNA ligase [Nocardioides sp. TRM66260-LWL]MBZ5732886.1 non-homologous end-joining DNA ligase [Nocardioides sp. TRM66260-LWL]
MSPGPASDDAAIRVEVDGRTLTINHLDKVLYPRTGTTKGEVLHYYASIAPVLLPQLRDRPITRVRWPHGVGEAGFFEKNVPGGTPSWVRTARVPTTGSRAWGSGASTTGSSRPRPDVLTMPLVDDVATLTWLANLAALELHAHQWRIGPDGAPGPADRVVVDLDPGDPAGLRECCQVALDVRGLAAEQGLDARPVLSGSKGLHLYLPLPEPLPAEQTTALAKELAERLQRDRPQAVTAAMAKVRRGGRVFVDWSQNAAAKTTVAPYSLRGRERPTVAAPITWAEVEAGASDPLGLEQLRFDEVLARVARDGDLLGP